MPNERIVGPSWLSAQKFDVQAVIPAGATKGQLRLMLQELLVDRFKIAVHRDTKVQAVYQLIVWKNAPGLKPALDSSVSGTDSSSSAGSKSTPEILPDKDGYPELPKDRSNASAMIDGRFRLRMVDMSMSDFAAELEAQVDHPVIDTTGLKGKYDLQLSWASTEGSATAAVSTRRSDAVELDDPGPTIFKALQDQLGLKLEKATAPLETIVIDQITKIPTEN